MESPDLEAWVLQYGPIRARQRLLRDVRPGGVLARTVQARILRRRAGPLDGDPETETLSEMWAMGTITAFDMWRIASAAVLVAPRPQMQAIADLGCHGLYPNKIASGLRKLQNRSPNDLPEPFSFKVPMHDPTMHPPQIVEYDYPISFLHEWLAALYEHYPAQFNAHIVGGQGAVSAFWAGMRPDDPRLFNHPVTQVPGYQHKCIPLRIHGDAAPYGKADGHSADILSASSMTGQAGDTWDTRMFIDAISNCCKGPLTMETIWRRRIWLMKVLQSGVWPTHAILLPKLIRSNVGSSISFFF